MEDVVYALYEQNQAGWLHGDVKSNNIVVKRNRDNSFSGKVVDFGLSKRLTDGPFLRHVSFKPANFIDNQERYPHIAPEILKGTTGDTTEGDVHSFGYILKNIALRFYMPKLLQMSQRCMQEDPKKRPTLPEILITLTDLKETEVREIMGKGHILFQDYTNWQQQEPCNLFFNLSVT